MSDDRPKPPKTHFELTKRAREARKIPSVAEQLAWSLLRNGQTGFKFRREHCVPPYRLDFYCAEVRVAIEFDGEQHNPKYDERRDKYINSLGIEVIRIPNREFFQINGEGKMVDHLGLALKRCEEIRSLRRE